MISTGFQRLKLKFDRNVNETLFSTQADSGRTFEVSVLDDYDNVVDITSLSLEFYVSAGKEVTKVIAEKKDAKQGIFLVRAASEQFKYPGTHKAQFVLKDGAGLKIGSKIYELYVEESIENGATVGRNVLVDFGIISQTLTLIKAFDTSLQEAKAVDLLLKANIAEGEIVSNDLKTNIRTAKTIDLKADIQAAHSAAEQLKDQTTKAEQNSTNLKENIEQANNKSIQLKADIKQAKVANVELTTKDEEAQDTKSSLQELLDKANLTEQKLREIIASGNLDKYVTDIKLQEALKNYATKEDLSAIDITEQLEHYAKKTDLKTKLSELEEDTTHRLVTDEEKEAWNGKVDKVDGKDLSTNDFTDKDKQKLDNLEIQNGKEVFIKLYKAGTPYGSMQCFVIETNEKYDIYTNFFVRVGDMGTTLKGSNIMQYFSPVFINITGADFANKPFYNGPQVIYTTMINGVLYITGANPLSSSGSISAAYMMKTNLSSWHFLGSALKN